MRKAVTVTLALVLALVLAPGMVVAQSDSGEIRIVVVDAATKAPVNFARVLLDGAVIASELTGQNGEVRFTDVPDGIYRARIFKPGYGSVTSASFEVLDGRVVTVDVSLVAQTGGLKVIGQVSVKASATISSTSIGQDSPQRRLADDLAGALNKLSGVSVQTSSDDSDATQTISLEGHDASQTQLTLDGIPLNAPGMAGNLRGFASDLFMGASVHMGPALGGLGGAVNFTTLQPTLSWLSQAALSAGSNGRYNYSLAESGSFGKLGMAAQTVYRLVPSWVDNDAFLDASGQRYSHDGDSSFSGNLLKLRYEFGDTQTLTGTFLNSARNTNLVCLRMYAPPALPCGYGPGNTSDSSVQLYSLTDNALLGATQIQASVYASTSSNLYDGLDRTVAVVSPFSADTIVPSPAPIGYSGIGKVRGFTVNATLPAKERHTLSLQAFGTSSTQSTTPLVVQALPYYNGSTQTSYSALQLTDTIRSSDALTLATSVGLSSATGGSGATALASAGATWRPTSSDALSASYAVGGIAATAGRSTILTDPASLRFDCNGDVAYGNAPGQSPGTSSSTSARVSYTRTLHAGSVSLSLYRQVQSGVLLPAYVNGTELESQFPLGYLQQVQAFYDSPAGCNAKSAASFGAQQLYFMTPIANARRIYEGGALTGYVTLGDLVVQPYYDVTVAEAISGTPLLQDPYAITISGSQLPNVPFGRAGIVLDFKAPHSILEWLADAQYVGKNNPNNLPAYTTFDAGVTAQLATGTLTFAASNVTGTFAGVFAGPNDAVPYVTLGGYTVGTTARPLAPRTYSLTYGLKFGRGAVTTQTTSAFTARRGPGGRPRFFAPLPASAPSDPFAVGADPQRCGSENLAKAQQLSSELKAAVAQIEAAKTPSGYPDTVALTPLADAALTYHGLGATYALTITPRLTGGFRAVAGCFTLHVARADEVAQRKLYTASSPLFFIPQLTFMPNVGLYIVARQPQAGREMFRVYKLPATAPSDPFALRASPTCTAQAKNLATQSLGELHAYFANGTKPTSWTISAHAAKSGTWYELEAGDPTIVPVLLACARVAAATAQEIGTRGYGSVPVPAL
ncbi:MAG TPA: TonB-dependent receptor, partial [Candidatus Baltobacteraceae bacterium]|nr:TonB-dependent receptor [Candidatus Baltobacteraceae bacterium]